MWLARYLPGLRDLIEIPPGGIRKMAPEETRALRAAGQKLVNREVEFYFGLAKLVATAASGVRFR